MSDPRPDLPSPPTASTPAPEAGTPDGAGASEGSGAPEVSGQKKLALDPDRPLSESLAGAVNEVLEYALGWTDAAEEHPEKSVHEFRKSLRRGRAALKLLRGMMDRRHYQELVGVLRDAARAASPLRDADALLAGVLKTYPRRKRSRPTLDALEETLRVRRDELHRSGRVARTLEAQREPLRAISGALPRTLPTALERRDLRRALRGSYRRCHEAWREACSAPSDAAVHDWRKRVKELRYQLELLAPLVGEAVELQAFGALAERIGEVTDLVVLRDTTARESAGDAAAREELLARLDASIEEEKRKVLDEGQGAFERTPKAFARHVLP